MTRSITSEIGSKTLLIPTSRDKFAIVSGGMPNGDDCLKITDPDTGDWYAYCSEALLPIIRSSPGGVTGVFWTLNVWFRMTGTTGQRTIFRYGQANSVVFNENTNAIRAETDAGAMMVSRAFDADRSSGASAGVWKMVTIVQDEGTVLFYVNGALVSTAAAGGGGLAAITVPEFSLGFDTHTLSNPRSARTSAAPPTGVLEFGKLSLWNSKVLTAVEIENLYLAMTS